MNNNKPRKLKCRDLCERYNCVSRTIGRWVAEGNLPAPMYINKIRYWDEAAIDAADRRRQVQTEAA
jgi:predicted site-specific integrase-resolvase